MVQHHSNSYSNIINYSSLYSLMADNKGKSKMTVEPNDAEMAAETKKRVEEKRKKVEELDKKPEGEITGDRKNNKHDAPPYYIHGDGNVHKARASYWP